MRVLAAKPKSAAANGKAAMAPLISRYQHVGVPLQIQRKLSVGAVNDPLEHEADRLAEQVMRMPATPHTAPSSVAPATTVLTRSALSAGDGGFAAPPIVHDALNSPGQPLDAATRAFMEPRFGYDFSSVRVHSDAKAAAAATSIRAQAFTTGQNIVFGAGQYAPHAHYGRALLSHELAHVVQNGGGKRSTVAPDGIQCKPDPKKRMVARKQPAPAEKNRGKGEVSADQMTVSAGVRSRDEILTTIRSLKSQLAAGPKSKTEYDRIVRAVKVNQTALLAAPIEPTPKRDYIYGSVHFSETYASIFSDEKNPNFYSLFFKSLSDKAWEKSWNAVYKLAAQEFSIVLSICDAIRGDSENDRSFDEEGHEKEAKTKGEEFVEEQAKEVPSHYLEHGVAQPLEHYGEKYGVKEAKYVARGASRLALAIDIALTAYEIVEANTEGPSLHAAALETAARIMGRAFNMARGINMTRGQGGEFIPHQTDSEVRVARNPLDRTPLPGMKDRRLAYNMVGNRVYEMMMDVLAPIHLASADAFIRFRNARIANAANIVENAGAVITDRSRKYGGKMVLGTERKTGNATQYSIDIGQIEGG